MMSSALRLLLLAAPAAALLDRERAALIPPKEKLAARHVAPRQFEETGTSFPTAATTSASGATRTATATGGEVASSAGRATATGSSATNPASQPTASTTGDPCRIFSSSIRGTLFSNEEVRACIKSIPLNEQTKANTLEVFSKMYDLAIFEYNQIDTPEPLFQKVDIRAELQRMQNTDYATDYDFSLDLSRTVDHLNDGHHYWSDCYGSSFLSFIPFPPVALNSDPSSTDPAKIYVAPDAVDIMDQYETYFYIGKSFLQDYYNGLGLNASFLAGKEITAINGQDPWDAIDAIANNEGGTYQTLQARRTDALASRSLVGITTARTLGKVAQQSYPERDNITYTIGGQDYVIPYVVRDVSAYSFSTATSFYTNNCLAASSSNSTSTSGYFSKKPNKVTPEHAHPLALFPELVSEKRDLSKMEKRQSYSYCDDPSEPYLAIRNDPRLNSAFLGGRDVQFYLLPQNASSAGRVGVIWLATFSPDSGCTNKFISDTQDGFANFSRAGVEKVIIDTTGNGGGSIALSIIWQSLFAGSQLDTELNFQSVLRKTPLAEKFVQWHTANPSRAEGYYGPTQFREADGDSYLASSADYLDGGSTLSINSKSLEVSSIIRDSTPSTYLTTQTKGIYAPSDVLIFGDGTCGSACASWASFLTRYLNVSTAVVHPRPGESTEFQNFEAGQAVTSTAIYSELELTNLEGDSDAPPTLLLDATMGFALRAHLVPGTTDQFIQYTPSPAGSTFGITEEFYLNPVNMWMWIAANGPLSSSPKTATSGQSTDGGTATGGGSSSSNKGGSGGNSAGFATVSPAHAAVAVGVAALAAVALC